jgi:hypothetical protein
MSTKKFSKQEIISTGRLRASLLKKVSQTALLYDLLKFHLLGARTAKLSAEAIHNTLD